MSATIHYTGCPLQTHLAVAKAGVDALSDSLAIELGPRGISSNVVAPGPIAGTEGLERLARKEDAQGMKAKIPLGRAGTVKDIADATVWLFSDAGNYVNGATIVGTCLSSPSPFPSFCFSLFLSLPARVLYQRVVSLLCHECISFPTYLISNQSPE